MKNSILVIQKGGRILISKTQLRKLLLGLIIMAIAFFLYYCQNDYILNNDEAAFEQDNAVIEVPKEITVNISGAVKYPGVITLPNGSRVFHAINQAGGLTENANISVINIAALLSDEEHVFIPLQDNPGHIAGEIQVIDITDNKEEGIFVSIYGEVTTPCVIKANKETSRIVDALKAAGEATDEADISKVNLAERLQDEKEIYIPRKGLNTSKLININTASEIELRQLSGIGEVIAKEIIRYRETKGYFKKIEDIKKVPGIGEGKFENICKEISVY